jgi:hypothetical protein
MLADFAISARQNQPFVTKTAIGFEQNQAKNTMRPLRKQYKLRLKGQMPIFLNSHWS